MVNFEHDFDKYPELSNTELEEIGFTSPHVQITQSFWATVVKVHDGDTVTLKCDFRDFEFPMRLAKIDAPELSTGPPGSNAKDYLLSYVEGQEVFILINPDNRVEKWGRLLGEILVGGVNLGDASVAFGYSLPFEQRREGIIPDFETFLKVKDGS